MVGARARQLHDQLEIKNGKLRAALSWALGGADSELGMRLVGDVFTFWWSRNHHREWEDWFAGTQPYLEHASPAARADALLALGGADFNVRQDLAAGRQHCAGGCGWGDSR